MVKAKLRTYVLIGIVIVTVAALSGCASQNTRIATAAEGQARASAQLALPESLPATCTAKIGAVRVGDEPFVATIKRYQILAENRNDQTDACVAWWGNFRKEVAKAANAD